MIDNPQSYPKHDEPATESSRMRFSLRPRHGCILVAVLGFVVLISLFVVQFLDSSMRQMRIRAIDLGRADLRTTAYSAMETTLAVLNEFAEIDEGLHSPSQGWADPLGYSGISFPEGVEVRVIIEDETGKLSLREPVPEIQLRLLLDQIGVRYDDADIMVDSLLDWIDEDDLVRLNGAEDAYYRRLNPPITPANAPLRSFDTLAHIRGFRDLFFDDKGAPNEMFYAFTNSVSLHSNAPINLNTAPPAVLAMLAENSSFDADLFANHILGPDRRPGTQDDVILRNADDLRQAGFLGETGEVGHTVAVLRITVEVSSGDKHFRLTTLLETEANRSSSNNQNQGRTPRTPEAESPGQTDGAPTTPRIVVPRRGQSSSPVVGINRSGPGRPQNSSGNGSTSRLTLLRSVENASFD